MSLPGRERARPAEGPGPTAPSERFVTVDILRGVAVLGILFVNMLWFSGPELYWGLLGERPWTGGADRAADALIRFAAEGKFLTMFSFLFGLGMAIQMRRAEARGGDFPNLYRRRLALLLVIGLAHGLLLWHGDILTAYAVLGFVLLLFRDQRDITLLGGAAAGILLPVILLGAFAALGALARASPDAGAEVAEQMGQRADEFAAAAASSLEAYGTGGYREALAQRARDFGFMWEHFLFWLPPILGLFLLGLWAGRRGIPADPASHRPLLRSVALWGLGVGVLANAWYAWGTLQSATGVGLGLAGMTYDLAHGVGAPLMGLGYMAGLALLLERPGVRRLLDPFAAVGRMALTNYLAHSVLCTTLFYGYGLGLYGRVGPAAGLLVTLGIFALQLAWSPAWLRRFRYGPVEWLWRCATYWRLEPLRKPRA